MTKITVPIKTASKLEKLLGNWMRICCVRWMMETSSSAEKSSSGMLSKSRCGEWKVTQEWAIIARVISAIRRKQYQ